MESMTVQEMEDFSPLNLTCPEMKKIWAESSEKNIHAQVVSADEQEEDNVAALDSAVFDLH